LSEFYYLDLFSGIGGFALGAHNAGFDFEGHYFSDIEEYAVKVYQKRFPCALPLGDIRKVDYGKLPRGKWIVTGGFPCQPHSTAGKRKGSGDKRDLWPECERMLRELRPEIALFENVTGLFVSNGGEFFNRILSDISKNGYDAEWQVISASEIGAPHIRNRVWITCYVNNRGGGIPNHNMKSVVYPTPVAADATTGAIIGKDDLFYTTKTGTPRRINKSGADGSLGLARFIKLSPTPAIGTPTASMSRRSKKFAKGRTPSPAEFVQMFPVPQDGDFEDEDVGNTEFWPTPRAGNPGSRPNKKGGRVLAEEVKKSFPTPKASDCKGAGPYMGKGHLHDIKKKNLKGVVLEPCGGQLNADWVEALMGYPVFWTDILKESIVDMDYPAVWLDGSWEKDIPRIIINQKNRVKRLTCIGNSIVPKIAEILFLIINNYLNKEDMG
jgi:site-specific DNA-cytosine methylase